MGCRKDRRGRVNKTRVLQWGRGDDHAPRRIIADVVKSTEDLSRIDHRSFPWQEPLLACESPG